MAVSTPKCSIAVTIGGTVLRAIIVGNVTIVGTDTGAPTDATVRATGIIAGPARLWA